MMSELGFVYFLLRAASRKTVKVWHVSQRIDRTVGASYLEGDLVRGRRALSGALDCAKE